MCVAPITIPNPYYKIGSKGLNFLHDTVNSHIKVPCGKCHQCCSLRQAYFNQRVQMESKRSELFMITLTYNDYYVPRIHYLGYHLFFPDWRDIQLLFKKLRKVLPHPVRYAMCSEYGSRKRRPHFHGIIAIDREDIKEFYKGSISLCEQKLSKAFLSNWTVNLGDKRHPDYRPLSTYIRTSKGRSTFDFHWIQPLRNHDNDVSFYVSKYVLKYDEGIQKLLQKFDVDQSLQDDQLKLLKSLIKPRCTMSKDFGSYKIPEVSDYINRCIEKDETDIPQFYDIYTGQASLLSRYYRHHCYTLDHAFTRFYFSDSADLYSSHHDIDGTPLDWHIDCESSVRESYKFTQIKKIVSKRCDNDL